MTRQHVATLFGCGLAQIVEMPCRPPAHYPNAQIFKVVDDLEYPLYLLNTPADTPYIARIVRGGNIPIGPIQWKGF